MTKKQELMNWMRDRHRFATHEILEYGCRNFFNRADRTKRDLVTAGIVRKLNPVEKSGYGYTCKDSVYVWVGSEQQMEMVI